MYVEWLHQQHPDVLPEGLLLASTSAMDLLLASISAEDYLPLSNTSAVHEEQTNALPDPTNNSTTAATINGSIIAANDITDSLSTNLANTRKFVTARNFGQTKSATKKR